MSSTSNSNPWSPYDSYNDCSQRVCNIYCPQWCYLIFPPPPPSFFLDDEDDSSSSSFSPLLIALIGILVSAFILVSYYTLISKYCHHRRSFESSERDHIGIFSPSSSSRQGNSGGGGGGLNESMIKSITVYKYRKGEGFVDGSDCSVCLSEFEEEESLRLLPKCNHAFHLPCIDTWLKSHSNCPLCRAFVVANQSSGGGGGTAEISSSTVAGHLHQTGDSVVVVEDLETGRSESQVQSPEEEQRDAKEDEEDRLPIRRSVSLSSGIVVSVADVLRESDEVSAGVGTSQERREGDGYCEGKTPPTSEGETAANERSGVSSFLVRSSVAMKRSVSTGRFIFSRYDRGRSYSLPN